MRLIEWIFGPKRPSQASPTLGERLATVSRALVDGVETDAQSAGWFEVQEGDLAPSPHIATGVSQLLQIDSQLLCLLQAQINDAVDGHQDVLRIKRRQLVIVDEYGECDTSGWDREVGSFVKRFAGFDELLEALTGMCAETLRWFPELRGFAEALLSEWHDDLPRRWVDLRLGSVDGDGSRSPSSEVGDGGDLSPPAGRVQAHDGAAFERRCIAILDTSGWLAQPTGRTGDQGADIIASKNGRRVVIQCKHHRQRIGNKAVQEVAAARQFYLADGAAVVGTSGFTKSAKSLAHANEVILVDIDQLQRLHELVGRF